MPITVEHDPKHYLTRFGLCDFRAGQHEVIRAILSGGDCVCIMPTGGGKSLCYQLPSVMREGLTLVVSPLIALMKDQVDSMTDLEIAATYINSSLSPEVQQERLQKISEGQFDLVYIAPERFRSRRFIQSIAAAKVQLLAIDEAHCVSQWGHDFRPDYARLGQVRERLGQPQTIALTATATPDVRQDLIQLLGLQDPQIFITGFARPNLSYEVLNCNNRREKDQTLQQFLKENEGPGIIYASSRERCGEVAELVSQSTGRPVGIYHAGLEQHERKQAQDDFMAGHTSVVVATVAFGMGIDKSNVRFVVHYNMPGSLEAYYQEAGRAGRDGKPARCLLLFSRGDRHIQEFFIESSYPSAETVARVYEYLRQLDTDPIQLTQNELKERLQLDLATDGIGNCEYLLEQAGALERLEPRQNMAAVRIDSNLHTLVDLLPKQATVRRKVLRGVEKIVGSRRHERVFFQPHGLAETLEIQSLTINRALRELSLLETFDYVPPFRGKAVHILNKHRPFEQLDVDVAALEQRKEAEYTKLNHMVRYARGPRCRQLEILHYFGQTSGQPCGNCDNCLTPKSDSDTLVGFTVDSPDDPLHQTILIALSGIARIAQRFGQRKLGFGKQIVAQMLCGSKSAKISKWKLQQLSTFGLLSQLTQSEVIRLLDALLEEGLIGQSEIDRFKPVLGLTDNGKRVMHGDFELLGELTLPVTLVSKLRSSPTGTPTASTQKPHPPSTAEEQTIASPVPEPSEVRPDYYWTWRLFATGFSTTQCTAIRYTQFDTILDHLLRAMEEGLEVDPQWILPAEKLRILDEFLRDTDPRSVNSVVHKLPVELSQPELQLYLKCRQTSSK
jgi:ATP-dependent DNA helicase RecQ